MKNYKKIIKVLILPILAMSFFACKLQPNVDDQIPPSWETGYPRTNSVTQSIEISLKLNEASRVYYTILPQDSTPPTPEQIINGNATDVVLSGSIIVPTYQEVNTTILGTEDNTDYDLYIIAADLAIIPNNQTSYEKFQLTTLDGAPIWMNNTPLLIDYTETTATIKAQLHETSSLYYLILTNDNVTPIPYQIRSGNVDGKTGSGEISIQGNTATDFTVQGLFDNQTFYIYLIAEDTNDITHTQTNVSVIEVNNEVDYTAMVLIPAGTFQMGDTVTGATNVHEVSFTYDYYIGKYELTFNQYVSFCGATGYNIPDDNDWGMGTRPVINVTWYDALNFCNWLSEQEEYAPAYQILSNGGEPTNAILLNKEGNETTRIYEVEGYRLPTESEWEYAARNLGTRPGYELSGGNTGEVNELGWGLGNSQFMTHPIGRMKPNELGIYDMSGNVWEFVFDKYRFPYPTSNQTNPIGFPDKVSQIKRGGSCLQDTGFMRTSFRYSTSDTNSKSDTGFRLARTSIPASGGNGNTLYVARDGNDTNTGLSTSQTLQSLQAAVDKAKSEGFTRILVTAETYTRGAGLNTNTDGLIIQDFSQLEISGGWNSSFSSQFGKSILDSENTTGYRGILVSNSQNINLNGFVVTGARTGTDATNGSGICMWLVNDSIISNCILTNNRAQFGRGGGLFVFGSNNNFSLTACSNVANGGGGVYLSNCINNTLDVIAFDNSATVDVGGVCIGWGAGNTITGTIYDNHADGHAGGIGVGEALDTTIMAQVYGNSANDHTGGIFLSLVTNCTVQESEVINNSYVGTSAGIHINRDSHNVSIIHTLITNNVSDSTATGGIYIQPTSVSINGLIISNCIIGGKTGASDTYGIYEDAPVDQAGHTIVYNLFLTNQIEFLYRDSGSGDIISNHQVSLLNTTTNIHDAAEVGNNRVDIENSMILVTSGNFNIGNATVNNNSVPEHNVTISYDFYIDTHEVTFSQWDEYYSDSGYYYPSDETWGRASRPVMNVSWFDAVEFCNWLSAKNGYDPAYEIYYQSGIATNAVMIDSSGNPTNDPSAVHGYRLPTEAEWEFTARNRGVRDGDELSGGTLALANDLAWYSDNSDYKSHPVMQKMFNELGLYDMSGNVWEWCYDFLSDYTSSAQVDPIGPSYGTDRVIRGGAWYRGSAVMMTANREGILPDHRSADIGFRVVRTDN